MLLELFRVGCSGGCGGWSGFGGLWFFWGVGVRGNIRALVPYVACYELRAALILRSFVAF